MSHLSKRAALFTAALLAPLSMSLAVVSGLPARAHAATTPPTNPFCTQLPSLTTRVNDQLTSMQNKLTTAWSQRDQAIAANDSKWTQALTTDRAKWNTLRQTQYSELQAKATTDAQKAAVQAFITAVNSALSTRQTANDQARAAFRTALHNLLASQRSSISSQINTFISAVNTAETTAQASCTANPDQGATIRTTFQTAMKNARLAYNSDRKGDNGIGDQVKQLAATRNAAIKANDAAFVKAVQAAAATLKAAFSGTNTSI